MSSPTTNILRSRLHECATLSENVYNTDNTNSTNTTSSTIDNGKNRLNYGTTTISGKNHLFFACRGTTNIHEIFQDIDIPLVPMTNNVSGIKVHQGFQTALEKLLPDDRLFSSAYNLLDYPTNKSMESTIIVTGHSLGGAIATLLAYRLVRAGYTVELITFGAPCVGNAQFAKEMQTNTSLTSYRCINKLDPIPHSLDWNTRYQHHCRPLDITASSTIVPMLEVVVNVINAIKSDDLAISKAGKTSLKIMTKNHGIQNYKNNLDNSSTSYNKSHWQESLVAVKSALEEIYDTDLIKSIAKLAATAPGLATTLSESFASIATMIFPVTVVTPVTVAVAITGVAILSGVALLVYKDHLRKCKYNILQQQDMKDITLLGCEVAWKDPNKNAEGSQSMFNLLGLNIKQKRKRCFYLFINKKTKLFTLIWYCSISLKFKNSIQFSDPIVTVTTKGINIHLQDLNKTYRLESDIDNNGNLKKWKNIIDNSRTSSRNIIRDNNNTINNIIKTTERWRRGMTTINDYCE